MNRTSGTATRIVNTVANLYSQPAHWIVRRKAGITEPKDLRGKSVAIGTAGSGDHAMSLMLLEHFGLDRPSSTTVFLNLPFDSIRKELDKSSTRTLILNLKYDQITELFKEDLLDAAFITAGTEAGVFGSLFDSDICDILTIPFVDALVMKHIADMLHNFLTWCGPDTWLDSINTETLLHYQRDRAKVAARSTVGKEVGTVLRLLRRNGLHVEKPSALKRGRETEIRPFMIEELDCFFEATGLRRAECLLMLATGARPHEIVSVRARTHQPLLKEEIDWENCRVLIRPSKLKPGEKAQPRWVPVQEEVLEVVRAKAEATEGVYAFPRWQNMGRDFRAALRRAGIPKRDALGRDLRMHSLRHTYCTLMAQQVSNALALSKLLGHKHVSTTERYYHGDPDTPILPMARVVDLDRIRTPDTQREKAVGEDG